MQIYFFTKGMMVWNALTSFIRRMISCYCHIDQYLSGASHRWLFIKGHTLPLPQSHCTPHGTIEWIYSDHVLTYGADTTLYPLSWLSATLVIANKEYDIDHFLSSFRASDGLSLTHLFLSWCAETKQWFTPDTILSFHIIDHQGDEQIVTLDDSLVVRGRKFYKA